MSDNKKIDQQEELPAQLLQFPCEFPMKIVAEQYPEFAQNVTDIIMRHCLEFNPHEVEMKQSSKGNYISIGVLIPAKSQEMLDAIYKEITSLPKIRFVL